MEKFVKKNTGDDRVEGDHSAYHKTLYQGCNHNDYSWAEQEDPCEG